MKKLKKSTGDKSTVQEFLLKNPIKIDRLVFVGKLFEELFALCFKYDDITLCLSSSNPLKVLGFKVVNFSVV